MEDAIYGGRVDNPYDARVLKAYLRKIFNQDVFDGRGDLMRGLSIPRPCAYDDALAAVAALPDGDAPALFGLPDNIERSVQRTQSAHAADQLRVRRGVYAPDRRRDVDRGARVRARSTQGTMPSSGPDPDIPKPNGSLGLCGCALLAGRRGNE